MLLDGEFIQIGNLEACLVGPENMLSHLLSLEVWLSWGLFDLDRIGSEEWPMGVERMERVGWGTRLPGA